MWHRIIELASKGTYDFRVSACPDDPRVHLFEEWVPHYRIKWAVAAALQPDRILEIGVRYGYSAMAFLDACPSAYYLGIEVGSGTGEGCQEAVRWAARRLRGRRADLVIADPGIMRQWPGGRYGLIHVGGWEDEEGLKHNVGMSLRQAEYVLLDGCARSPQTLLTVSEILFYFRELIEWCFLITGHAGDLLIRPKGKAALRQPAQAERSDQLRTSYTREYYLSDCGGYDSFKRSRGATVEDERLLAVIQFATTGSIGRALDLGCGRGEVSLELARRGYDVTAVDYSQAAIRLARDESAANSECGGRVQFHCCDVNAAPLHGLYDVVIASDLVEHLSSGELDQLYGIVARHLSPEGFFLVHTFPNLWHYRYDHSRRLRIARGIGAYLPVNPRSRYERLMHINEQSPRVLRRQLARTFPHVDLWFGRPESPADNLMRTFSISEMRSAPDLFAVASHAPIPRERLTAPFRMDTLPMLQGGTLHIEIDRPPREARGGLPFQLGVRLRNTTDLELRSSAPFPVHLSYHWMTKQTEDYIVFGGRRTSLRPSLRSGQTREYQMTIEAPRVAGEHRLRVTLVQELVRWLNAPPESIFLDIIVSVL